MVALLLPDYSAKRMEAYEDEESYMRTSYPILEDIKKMAE
jgi:hypothetical protein